MINNKNEYFLQIKNKIIDSIGSPYYENDFGVLFCTDTLKAQKLIDFKFADLVVTSPPYNIGKEYETKIPIEEYVEWSKNWINDTYNITKDNGAMLLNLGYVNIEGVARAIPLPYLLWDKVPFYLNQEIVWNYSAGVACKKFLSPRNEKFLWYVKNQYDYTFNLDNIRDKNVKYPNSKKNGKLRNNTLGKNPSDVWEIAKVTTGTNRSSKERMPHPCQFPLDVLERILLGFSNEQDIIFDPFMGSGSTFEASLKFNRYCIGFEIREDYCKIIKERVSKFQNDNGVMILSQDITA